MKRKTAKRVRAARRAAVTRKMYAWEDLFVKTPPVQPIAVLRRLANRIWQENTRRRDRCPRIVAGRGLPQGGCLLSYCEGRSLIVLARHQRERRTLIHEMTHALGPETHGLRFQTRYADLLGRYL